MLISCVGWWYLGWWKKKKKKLRHRGVQTETVVEVEVPVPTTVMLERRRGGGRLYEPFRERITIAPATGEKYHVDSRCSGLSRAIEKKDYTKCELCARNFVP